MASCEAQTHTQSSSDSSALGVLSGARPKVFYEGTHRTCAPEETLHRLRPHFARLGITRLADITGLDVVGIPVAQAIRPMSRSLSVKQGKGANLAAAFASAAMEAAEAFHAETVAGELRFATARQLKASGPVADPDGMCAGPAAGPTGLMDVEMSWLPARNLVDGCRTWVPFDCVHLDFTRPAETDFLDRSSNGLASGNTLAGAVAHALLELIERDALAHFWTLEPQKRRTRRIDPRAVERRGATAATMIAKVLASGLRLDLFDATNDLAVPVAIARIYDTSAARGPRPGNRVTGASIGHGAHLDPDVALARAVAEAAQSRLTLIAGSRDDISPRDYAPRADHNVSILIEHTFDVAAHGYAKFDYSDASGATAADDVVILVSRLRSVGLSQILIADLSREELPINVVRVLVPGLGRILGHRGLLPGRRFARAAAVIWGA
jgi:ribosomal protein S12 methylthiotransferase accessory factor